MKREELAKKLYLAHYPDAKGERCGSTFLDVAREVEALLIEARLEELEDMPNYERKINRIELLQNQLKELRGL